MVISVFHRDKCVFLRCQSWSATAEPPITWQRFTRKHKHISFALLRWRSNRKKKKINLKMFYSLDLVFSTRMIHFPLLKWRLSSISRNLEISNCSQLMGKQSITKCLMKTVPLWGNWCLGDVMVGYHNIELPLQQANNDLVKCWRLTLPVFDFNMIIFFSFFLACVGETISKRYLKHDVT